MPGWHDATRKLRDEDRIVMVGIVEEQHPDRARLFMQWKEMDWPILVDSLNLLGVTVVPVTLAVDEHGIVRRVGPDVGWLGEFVATTYEPPLSVPAPQKPPGAEALVRAAREADTAEAWEAYGDASFLRGDGAALDDAVAAYLRAVELEPRRSTAHFRLGVAYRTRDDSEGRRPGDFQRAVDHWSRALELDPNHYVYRRRIQQYGPRLDKPYPFYDWVEEARREIAARGETPVPLGAEPGGAEIAEPARRFEPAQPVDAPDPEGRILRDPGRFVRIETTVVPAGLAAQAPVRVHVRFRPDPARDAHWNNEISGLTVWLEPPDGFAVDRRKLVVDPPRAPVSEEPRVVEFEVRAPDAQAGRAQTLAGYALYYVCEGIRGACLYRRQDFAVPLRVSSGP